MKNSNQQLDAKIVENRDGSLHVTEPSVGWHKSFDVGTDGKINNEHYTEHSSGKTYYTQDTNPDVGRGYQGTHKEGELTDEKGNDASTSFFSWFFK